MWRRAYLLLALVRLYFALSPSYLHPDENFQGPEVIAGEFVLALNTNKFCSSRASRSDRKHSLLCILGTYLSYTFQRIAIKLI